MSEAKLGLSLTAIALIIAAGCSSKTADGGGKAGSSSSAAGAAGSASSSGGTSSSEGGSSQNIGGSSSDGGRTNGGSASGGSASGGACTAGDLSCLDNATAQACNPDTNMFETIDCVNYYKGFGIVSDGCLADANGSGCNISDFTDQACATGAYAAAFCLQATDEQFLNLYVNCYQNADDGMGHLAHTAIPCLSDYVTPDMMTQADCQAGFDACFGDGSAGAGGAGP